MSQFMTPAVTPDAVQSLAAGGQLLQEQYNQQQQNARTSAQIGAETRMHSESLAQDSAEKAAYRQHQSQITAAEIASRQTEASKERELRVRLAQTQMENEQRLAEIENAVTEAEISGNPEAIKQAHEAREAFVQSQTDLSAAETAHNKISLDRRSGSKCVISRHGIIGPK